MRQAGTIASKADAERFANYLLSLGISSKVDPAADQWAVWIHDENQLARSKQELDQFHAQPGDPRYEKAEQAAKLRAAKPPKSSGWRRRTTSTCATSGPAPGAAGR